ncbi:PaaI family thioesterase [Sphingomonas sediminicola]|uniref:PaaI family thioesterase n=1 Tax=Sphingomonas sediminicola TaxID=386874 RepID=UPI0031B5BC99
MRNLPPYVQLLKLRIEDGDHGPLVVMPFHDDVVGRPGYLHGGAIAGLLEFAAFTALGRELGDEGVVMKPITVTVDYMRGGTARETFAAAIIERLGPASPTSKPLPGRRSAHDRLRVRGSISCSIAAISSR